MICSEIQEDSFVIKVAPVFVHQPICNARQQAVYTVFWNQFRMKATLKFYLMAIMHLKLKLTYKSILKELQEKTKWLFISPFFFVSRSDKYGCVEHVNEQAMVQQFNPLEEQELKF